MDVQAGGDVIIPRGEARFAALTLQGLADGMMEASILIVYEQRFRPEEKRHRPWTDYQGEKVARALSVLEAAPPAIGPISVISRSLRARLSRFPFRGELARRKSRSCRLAG